jgi:predicted outer membrane repeat protein
MLSLLTYPKTEWNDYFSGTTPSIYSSQLFTSRLNPSNISVYVSNCLFRDITSSSSGGALYCTSITYLLVESTSFFSCKTSNGNGGAIYFYYSSGQCVLHGVCGYDCCTTDSSDHQFAYILVNSAASSKNNVNYSSIVCCVNVNARFTLYLYYGKIRYQSVNSSMNKCRGRTGICCWPSGNCSFSYSSFVDNNATVDVCITCYGTNHFEIKSCNILRNTQNSLNSLGTFYTEGPLTIQDSCILENKATYIFHQANAYTITLSNCTVDSTSNNKNLIIQSTITKSFILALNHISTQNCHSEYDVVGTLTPIISSSSSMKQIHCYTGNKHFLHLQITDVLSLTKILIFNFIHPYASIYS